MKKMKIPLSTFIFLSILMTSLEGFAQSKKEQIDALNFSIDSLVVENSNLKIKLLDKDKLISENEKVIHKNEEVILQLSKTIEINKTDHAELVQNNEKLNNTISDLIIQNVKLKSTIDSLKSSLNSARIVQYSLSNIEGTGENCNCGCDAEKQVNGNWEHLGTFACENPKCTGSKIINDYFNSFWIILVQDKFTFQVENKDAIKGQLLNQPVKNKQSVLYESDFSNYVFREVNDYDCEPYAILFGTLESITDIQLIHEINNTIHLTFNDGGSNYSFLFSIN
jgi:hypothetical protein